MTDDPAILRQLLAQGVNARAQERRMTRFVERIGPEANDVANDLKMSSSERVYALLRLVMWWAEALDRRELVVSTLHAGWSDLFEDDDDDKEPDCG